jgi:hypothetical protein
MFRSLTAILAALVLFIGVSVAHAQTAPNPVSPTGIAKVDPAKSDLAKAAAVPAPLPELKRQAITIAIQGYTIAEQTKQLAQANYEKAAADSEKLQAEAQRLIKEAQVEGYTVDLKTGAYTAKPPEPKTEPTPPAPVKKDK